MRTKIFKMNSIFGFVFIFALTQQSIFCQEEPISSGVSSNGKEFENAENRLADSDGEHSKQFSELPGLENGVVVPAAAPTPHVESIHVNLDNPASNPTEEFIKALTPPLENANVPSSEQRQIPISIEITPPPNSNSDYLPIIQNAVRTAISKLVPFAGTSMRLSYVKMATGDLANIRLNINVILPATISRPTTLNPTIDLSQSSALQGLSEKLLALFNVELSKAGYQPSSKEVQNFTISFDIVPPANSTKDYAKLYVLHPIQEVLRKISPDASLVSMSVNTQEMSGKIVRQTIKSTVEFRPVAEPIITENVVNVPKINADNSAIYMILEEIIKANVQKDSEKSRTLSIPFQITTPKGASEEIINEIYYKQLEHLKEILIKLDPSGSFENIRKVIQPDGNVVVTIYFKIPPKTQGENGGGSIKPEKTITTSTLDLTPGGNGLSEENLKRLLGKYTKNVDTQTIEIPVKFKLPKGVNMEKIEYNLVKPLSEELNKFVPNGKVLSYKIKTLPNDECELLLFFEIPGQNKKVIENVIDQKRVIDLSKISSLKDTLESKLKDSNTNERIEFPFVIPEDQVDQIPKISEKIEQFLEKLVPGSKITPELKPKRLNDGNYEFVINFDFPPEGSENSVDIPPIDLSKPDLTPLILSKEIQQILRKHLDDSKTINFSFLLDKSQVSNIAKNADLLYQIFKTFIPNAKINVDLEPKILNDKVEFNISLEVPATATREVDEEINETIWLPKIDLNIPGLNLVRTIENFLIRSRNEGAENQTFGISFKLNPYNKQKSFEEIIYALKQIDPSIRIISNRIKAGEDGFEHLDLIFSIKNEKERPQIITEAIVNINSKEPFRKLMAKVIEVVDIAEKLIINDTRRGQIVKIPLNFRITNSKGMSDAKVNKIINSILPQIVGYIKQIYPDGKIFSITTVSPSPESDDVILKILVDTPFTPDDVIVVNNEN